MSKGTPSPTASGPEFGELTPRPPASLRRRGRRNLFPPSPGSRGSPHPHVKAGDRDLLQRSLGVTAAAPPVPGPPLSLADEADPGIPHHRPEPAAKPAGRVVDEIPHRPGQVGAHLFGIGVLQARGATPAVDQGPIALQEGPPGHLVWVPAPEFAQERRAGGESFASPHKGYSTKESVEFILCGDRWPDKHVLDSADTRSGVRGGGGQARPRLERSKAPAGLDDDPALPEQLR
jgi:hypothetical protein